MEIKDIGPEVVETLKQLTKEDKLIWQKGPADITGFREFDFAYLCPWIFCLEIGQRIVLEVARSYAAFEKLEGVKYGLGGLSSEVASQRARFRIKTGEEPKTIPPDKIKKFFQDKRRREERGQRQRLRVLGQCSLAFYCLKKEEVL